MARSDAVQVILEVVARMRALDPRLRVTYEPGWETRGNGLSARYVGGIVHDTTTPSSPAKPFPTQNMLRVGRPDLSGPIANFGGPYCTVDAPWIHVVAAFPANHAGASGGRSMGPLPKTNLFNPTVLGLEIDFSGLTLMPAGQMYVGHLWARAVADVLAGGNVEYVRAHFETSVTGKIDISYANGKSYDMAAFRRDAAAVAATSTPTPDLGDDMILIQSPGRPPAVIAAGHYRVLNAEEAAFAGAICSKTVSGNDRQYDLWRSIALSGEGLAQLPDRVLDTPIQRNEQAGGGVTTLRAQALWEDYNFRTVTPEKVAELVGAVAATGGVDVAVLAKAVADELDRRARDGDPATGPVS